MPLRWREIWKRGKSSLDAHHRLAFALPVSETLGLTGGMKTILLSLSLLATVSLTAPAAETIQLFNGKDLSGWEFDVKDGADPLDIWSVKDGILFCTGKPAGVIRTKKYYSNYELTLEWRWPEGSKGGNNGCLIHSQSPRELGIWPKSLEVQLASGNAGDFWVIGCTIDVEPDRKPAKGRRILNLTDNSEKPIGQWNTMKILSQDGAVTVWVNGDKVNEGTNCSLKEGAISLQSEGAPIQFRKVELKPL